MDIPEKISSTEKAPDNSGEIRIFDKGDGPGKRKENFSAGRTLFVVGFIVAILCIGIGIFKAWEAFREFDETIMREKDSQFYSLISSEDISLENSLDSFCREAETYFERQVLKQLVREWNESEDGSTKDLREYISSNNLTENPVYSDILMMKDYGKLEKGDTDVLEFKRGDIIFREGDAGNYMYAVYGGSVGIYTNYGTAQENKLTQLYSDAFFGEMGLIGEEKRSATAVVEEDGTILECIRAEDMETLFKDNPVKIDMIL